MYTRQYFIEQFRELDTDQLLDRFVTMDLVKEAKDAMFTVLRERGINEEKFEALLQKAMKEQFRTTTPTHECDFCGRRTGFTPIRDEGQKFCSKYCLRAARLLEVAVDIPDQEIIRHAAEIKNGPCPICHGKVSKIEARKSYWIWSIVIYTRWGMSTKVCCKKCGTQKNLISIGLCMLFGWWGIPYGLVLTPVKIISNTAAIFKRFDNKKPSTELIYETKLILAEALLNRKNDTVKNIV